MSGLYLASTPLIAIEAAGAALAAGETAELVLIEDFDLAPRFEALLRRWRDNPFRDIHRLPGRYTEHQRGAGDRQRGVAALLHRVRVKRELRRQTLAKLAAIDAALRPATVWVGNDRKVETQYALHLCAQRSGSRCGRYLDDGLYTYLGDVRQRPLVRRIDWAVKRLTYGRWWQRADQAGTTRWIGESFLAFPDEARDADPGRRRTPLPTAWFANRALLRLCLRAGREFGLDRRALAGCGLVLVLPHSNQLRANPALAAALRELIATLSAGDLRIGLKYHPREVEPDPGDLLRAGDAVALPALLPMELLLPLLPPSTVLAGEGSTALLAARWLDPWRPVFDLGISRDGYAARARALFARHGIRSVEGDPRALAGAAALPPAWADG
ncbi:hypothetical protein [Arenimonas composti]|uniref:Polysaccharide pyruvyl transferase domain-containing protein n=1 Tax=Arenimonas composti TR7-09 = DSM 18010 TaxID=1121013 RepID=A0A091BDT4_9GAMM|nr:hypothetical protein [Arenimonas composti]KFN49896.1 hypothetical protein P873_08615 [Arenimonas composti TR7-09 = DSM 18010]